MEVLRQNIEAILGEYTGRFGLVIVDQANDQRLELNADMVFPAASMIKVPIMYEIMRQVAVGTITLDDSLVVKSGERVNGAGILQELRPDIAMTIKELVTLMIVLSDNIATNMLIELVGMDSVNKTMLELGLQSTVLRRKMMDFEAARLGAENQTTASDVTLLFSCIENSVGVPTQYGTLMLDILKRQQVRDKLPFYLPEDVVLANKTGTLSNVEHDGGILYLPGGSYLICVLTADLAVNYQGLQLVASIGRVIYDHFDQGEE